MSPRYVGMRVLTFTASFSESMANFSRTFIYLKTIASSIRLVTTSSFTTLRTSRSTSTLVSEVLDRAGSEGTDEITAISVSPAKK